MDAGAMVTVLMTVVSRATESLHGQKLKVVVKHPKQDVLKRETQK